MPQVQAPPYGRSSGAYQHGLLAQPDCSNCPLRRDVKVLPDGPVPARIAFVGEEPGTTEIGEGRGFVGPSGQLLWMLAKDSGIVREDVWVTNAALCAARNVKLPNGAITPKLKVKSQAAQCCRPRLLAELAVVDPIVIVPLGNWALWALSDIPNARIYAYRGSRIAVDLIDLLDRVQTGRANTSMREVKEG